MSKEEIKKDQKQNQKHEDLNLKIKELESKINELNNQLKTKEYEAKIIDLNNQIKTKDQKIHELQDSIKLMNETYVSKLSTKMKEAQSLIDQKIKEINLKVENEKVEYKKYAFAKPITEFIGILNDLSRAINSNANDPKINNYLSGLKLYLSILNSWLKSIGVNEIEVSINQEFNSDFMEAIDIDKSGQDKKFYVTKIIAKGYKLYDRLLVPTKVVISNLCSNN